MIKLHLVGLSRGAQVAGLQECDLCGRPSVRADLALPLCEECAQGLGISSVALDYLARLKRERAEARTEARTREPAEERTEAQTKEPAEERMEERKKASSEPPDLPRGPDHRNSGS